MQTNRFGRKIKLRATIAIKHQILKSMLDKSIKAEMKEGAEATQPEERPLLRAV